MRGCYSANLARYRHGHNLPLALNPPERINDFLMFGKTSARVFREDDASVRNDIKDPLVALNQLSVNFQIVR